MKKWLYLSTKSPNHKICDSGDILKGKLDISICKQQIEYEKNSNSSRKGKHSYAPASWGLGVRKKNRVYFH